MRLPPPPKEVVYYVAGAYNKRWEIKSRVRGSRCLTRQPASAHVRCSGEALRVLDVDITHPSEDILGQRCVVHEHDKLKVLVVLVAAVI